jgi:malic enzyme
MSHTPQPVRPQTITTTNALSGQHVIVIGAGYAGLMCALQLARVRFHIQRISLGRRDGLVQRVHADDSPRRQILTGRPRQRSRSR